MSNSPNNHSAAPPLPRSPELMRRDDTALLVVDVQERLLKVIPDAPRIIVNCRRLLQGARVLGVRAAITEQNPEKLGPTDPQIAAMHSGELAAKMAFSCGACGEIVAGYRDAGIERVLVCGIETHVCIAQTAFDLLAAGYQTLIAVDAVAARSTVDHDIALRRLESSGATLTTVEAALYEWCQQAGTPEFRQISALVIGAKPPT
jgi:nicotinamidase-related amidase